MDAALLLNKGYWSLSDTSYAFIYGHGKDSRAGVLPSRGQHGIETVNEHHLIPWLMDLYEALYS